VAAQHHLAVRALPSVEDYGPSGAVDVGAAVAGAVDVGAAVGGVLHAPILPRARRRALRRRSPPGPHAPMIAPGEHLCARGTSGALDALT
jgi:hypothetical protein